MAGQSTTWSTSRLANGGLYQLNTFEERYLGLTGTGFYGFDNVNLGIVGQGLPSLQNQLVAGFATDNYWLGSLGLSPTPFNISTLDSPIPSLLGTLRNQSIVPGSSWAYTAGAFYKQPQMLGSLTFGGYDASRLDSHNVLSDVAFGAVSSRDLVVRLQTITYDTLGSAPLLTQGIDVFIDSMVSGLWLPVEVCQNFEKAFNLTWDTNSSLYLIDEHVHSALLAQNPTFTFNLGTGGGNQTAAIVFPYAAFDLNFTLPITNGPSRYFPLQRAQNFSQYTLGRVFLQEAYVIADYDRNNFTVAQAAFPSTSVLQELIAVCAPNNMRACRALDDVPLSKGGIAGVVVGAVVLLCLLGGGLIWLCLRRRQRRKDLAASIQPAAFSSDKKVDDPADIKGGLSASEMDVHDSARHELDNRNEVRPELESGDKHAGMRNRHELMHHPWLPNEMATKDVAAVELEAPVK